MNNKPTANDNHADPPTASPSLGVLVIGGGVVLAVIIAILLIFDRHPWPSVGVSVLTYVFFVAYHSQGRSNNDASPPDEKVDYHLCYFLTSQLFLAYFSKWELGKWPNGDSPLSASRDLPASNKHLRLGLAGLFQDETLLAVIEYACISSWLLAIVLSLRVNRGSWFRKVTFAVLSLSYVFLHGIMAGLNGVSHRFYMPAYAFVSLFLEEIFGVDSHPYVCLFAGFTFFSAGVSKVRNSASWWNGRALCHYTRFGYEGYYARLFCATMAPLSMIFEVAGPFLMLLGPMGTTAFCVLALSFHLGIAILMFPRYSPQACSYVLLFRSKQHRQSGTTKRQYPLLFATCCLLLLGTTWFRIEEWPLTAVSMYSIDVHPKFGTSHREAYETARIVDTTKCISSLSFPRHYIRLELEEGGNCGDRIETWSPYMGKIKVVKQVLLRGVASAMMCNSNFCDENYWLDKYARAVWDECQMDSITFWLVMRRTEPLAVYTWKSSDVAAPIEAISSRDEEQTEL